MKKFKNKLGSDSMKIVLLPIKNKSYKKFITFSILFNYNLI